VLVNARALDQRLWVEGNLSVDYGGELQQSTKPVSLVFDPKEMQQAMRARLVFLMLSTLSRPVFQQQQLCGQQRTWKKL
jgi:hypothetical protein